MENKITDQFILISNDDFYFCPKKRMLGILDYFTPPNVKLPTVKIIRGFASYSIGSPEDEE